MVGTGVIDDRSTEAEKLEKAPAEQSAAGPVMPGERPVTAGERPEERATSAPASAAEAGSRRVWSKPSGEMTRKYADEVGRFMLTFGAGVVKFGRNVAKFCWDIVTFGWHIVGEVPPALRLLGALGLSALVSIVGSVTLDSALGAACAIVLVPGFAIAFGVVAHKWYSGLGEDRKPRTDVENATPSTSDLERSVEYVDGKLAFALNAFGTERHQQAVIALIQAKTATELAFGTTRESVLQNRPRIRDGGAPTTPQHEGFPASGPS